jgi:UDPglucose 6-dehydrogenase
MEICIIGTGYVGLVTGICLAEIGNSVCCIDVNGEKISALNAGHIPIYEPGLEEMLGRNLAEGRLSFTTDTDRGIQSSKIIFITVGTPSNEDGSIDMKNIYQAAKDIGTHIKSSKIIVNKSTVPVGTADVVKKIISNGIYERGLDFEIDVVSNPEFLKEGAAIDDFMKPDRVVIGSDSPEAIDAMKELYKYFLRNGHPVIVMDTRSAEMTKYAANAMLAAKISFMNEISNICELLDVDVDHVRNGIGSDTRIGYKFLNPGPGFGGSCFPKDITALIHTVKGYQYHPALLEAVHHVNLGQKKLLASKVIKRFGQDLNGQCFAVWGLSFKPKTNDMRSSPAIDLVRDLSNRGAIFKVFDPAAMDEARKYFEGLPVYYAPDCYDAVMGCDALMIVTEWSIFRNPDFKILKMNMKSPVIFDGRNIFNLREMKQNGFEYYSIGRQAVKVEKIRDKFERNRFSQQLE